MMFDFEFQFYLFYILWCQCDQLESQVKRQSLLILQHEHTIDELRRLRTRSPSEDNRLAAPQCEHFPFHPKALLLFFLLGEFFLFFFSLLLGPNF
jgi:hypothetical protein